MSKTLAATLGVALFTTAMTAAAQPAPPPVSFDRRAIEPALTPRAIPEAAIPDAEPVAPTAAQGAFVLRDVALEGATVLPPATFEDIWAPLLGQPVTVAELEAVAAGISARYRARGFILSQAVLPAQTVEDGVVQIRVIEGFLDDTVVDGGTQSGRIAARRFFTPPRVERPLRLETFERAVILTRDALGPDVDTVLEPSPDTFGAARASVVLPAERQVDGFIAADNYGSRLYGPLSVSAGLTAYDLAGLTERIELLAAVAPNEDYLAFGQARVSVPPRLFDGGFLDGTRVELLADYTRGDPDLTESGATGFDSLDEEFNLGVALITPFVRSRAQNLFGEFRLTRRYNANSLKFGDIVVDDLEDVLYIAEARLTWDRADAFGGVTLVDVGLRQGLDVFNAGVDGPSAARGSVGFTAADATLIRLQRLGDSPFTLYALAKAQIAGETLPSSERFGIGGDSLGRGFAPGNTTGDSGYGGRLELRYELPVARLGAGLAGAQGFVFGDYGQGRDDSAVRDGMRWETLGAAGAGIRIDVTDSFSLTPSVAVQLAGTPVDTPDDDRETRLFVAGVMRF